MKDLFVFFTDGIYEVDNAHHKEYGQERLLRAVTQRSRLPGDQLFDELLQEVRGFSTSTEFEDDVCLVGMEINKIGL